LQEGAARHARGDLAGAERLYRRVLALREDPNALNLLGVLARQRHRLQEALELSARALALRPDSPVFLASRGAALAEAGRLPEAMAALRAALSRRPDDPVTLRNLGQVLCAAGDPAAALPPLERAVALAPQAAEPRLALAHAWREAGQAEAARTAARAALTLAEAAGQAAIATQARFLLAALGQGEAPDRAPAAYVQALFDQYAPRFDAELQGRLGYRTPEALAELIARAGGMAPGAGLRVLDLGCGTGLSGLALAPFAARLEGLDISAGMLGVARERGIYAELHQEDLLDHLPRRPGAFELVAAADVLNYLGDLAPALSGIATALTPGGLAAFSLETGEPGTPFALGEGLRYRHDPDHVASLAAAAGLHGLAREEVVLRQEVGRPVSGTLVLMRKG
jgi:predicted TPR repeat methyltransferase